MYDYRGLAMFRYEITSLTCNWIDETVKETRIFSGISISIPDDFGCDNEWKEVDRKWHKNKSLVLISDNFGMKDRDPFYDIRVFWNKRSKKFIMWRNMLELYLAECMDPEFCQRLYGQDKPPWIKK